MKTVNDRRRRPSFINDRHHASLSTLSISKQALLRGGLPSRAQTEKRIQENCLFIRTSFARAYTLSGLEDSALS